MIALPLSVSDLIQRLFMRGRAAAWLKASLLLAVLGSTPVFAQQTIDSAYLPQLKAAYLINFVRYTEWPQTSEAGTLNLCTPSSGTLNGELAKLGTVQAGNKTVNITFIGRDQLELLSACHILFLDSSNDMLNREILEVAMDLPLLIVSDRPGYLDEGLSHIQFEVIQNKLR